MKKIMILILLATLLTGCNYVELNKLAVVSALGIDYKDNKYEITAQVMDVKKADGGSMEETSIIYEADGETIGKAIRNMSKKYPKTIYLGHLELIVIGEQVAREKMNHVFDYIIRSPESRSTGYVLVNKESSAKETLNPSNENSNGFATEQIISAMQNNEERTGTVKMITFDEFLTDYLQPGLDPIIPLVKVEPNSKDQSKTIISEMAAIKNNRITSSLTDKQSIAYNTINNNYYDVVITPEYKNKSIGVILFNPKSKIKVKLKDNKLKVNINIKVESKLNEFYEKERIENLDTNKELEQEIKKEIKKYIKSLIDYSKVNNVDTLGIGNKIYKNYYKEYPKYKDKNLYEISDINIKVKTEMYRSGNTSKGATKNE